MSSRPSSLFRHHIVTCADSLRSANAAARSDADEPDAVTAQPGHVVDVGRQHGHRPRLAQCHLGPSHGRGHRRWPPRGGHLGAGVARTGAGRRCSCPESRPISGGYCSGSLPGQPPRTMAHASRHGDRLGGTGAAARTLGPTAQGGGPGRSWPGCRGPTVGPGQVLRCEGHGCSSLPIGHLRSFGACLSVRVLRSAP
jgi:hypothetical protein